MTNKEKIKLLEEHFMNEDGEISFKDLNLIEYNVSLEGIRVKNLLGYYVHAKHNIYNEGQRAEIIYNTDQEAKFINNQKQKASRSITNSRQISLSDIINENQKALNITNQRQTGDCTLKNERQKANTIFEREKEYKKIIR